MKFRRRSLPLSLLFLHLLPLTYGATPIETADAGKVVAKDTKDAQVAGPDPASNANLLVKANSNTVVGTKDAPVDGKDGRPHEGPFVETSAERDRKKAKESGEDEAIPPGKKPLPKDAPKGASYVDGWKVPMPESNDGVMDDPNRLGPKEGTRGTEGGISEKNKEKAAQDTQVGPKTEKKPDSPKEAPPLPHSEQEKLDTKGNKELGKEESKEQGSAPKELGGLEVSFPLAMHLYATSQDIDCRRRNQPTFLRNHMMSHIQFPLVPRKIILST